MRFRLPLIALVLIAPAELLAQQVQDFSLPPAPAPSAAPRVQGPVDTESGVVPVRPRVIATATPTPTPAATPGPSSATTATPAPSRSAAQPRTQPAQQVATRTAAPSASRPAPVERSPVVPQEFPPVDDGGATPTPIVTTPAPASGPPATAQTIEPSDEEGFDWTWAALGAALLALLGGGLALWRRRMAYAPPPEIEKPVVAAAAARPAIAAADALTLRCEAEKLIRSAAFATLKYRLTLVNRTDAALTDVEIGIDLVSAHAGAPMEQQVATLATPLDRRHTLARIAPRQNVMVEGQVQLPLASAQVIFQGRHPLLVPLMRVRVDGAGEDALVKTFVVGQGAQDSGRVQPFRLDEPPRSYAPIAHRELA